MASRITVLAGLALAASTLAQTLPDEQALVMHYLQGSLKFGPGVSGLAAGDLDGDADLDLVITDTAAGVLRVVLNQGSAGFSSVTIAAGGELDAVALADVDADDDVDILAGLSDRLRVLFNDGSATFQPGEDLPFPAWDLWPVAVHATDIDGDGPLDVVIALAHHSLPSGSWTGGLIVARGDGLGGFALMPTHPLLMSADTLLLADLDGDTLLDAAGLAGYTSSSVQLAFGQGDGTFVNGTATYAGGAYAGDLTAGDWDGDGDVDLATGNKYTVGFLLNDGVGAFTGGGNLSIGYYVKGLAAGDLDLDGDTDIVGTSGSSAALRVLSNDGAGHFQITASLQASAQAYALILADTNGDGYEDAWAGDVFGQLTHADSACLVARYGASKPTSLGSLPAMSVTGEPVPGATDFAVHAKGLLIQQPAIVLVGLAPASQPFKGGELLVAAPWFLLPAATGDGSGDPVLADGALDLPIGAAQIAALGAGLRVHLQVWSADPAHPDGTGTSLTDALWFQVAP